MGKVRSAVQLIAHREGSEYRIMRDSLSQLARVRVVTDRPRTLSLDADKSQLARVRVVTDYYVL